MGWLVRLSVSMCALLVLALASACSDPQDVSRREAEALINEYYAKSQSVRDQKYIQYTYNASCMVDRVSSELTPENFFVSPYFRTQENYEESEGLAMAVKYGLLKVKLEQAAMADDRPPEFCRYLWDEYRSRPGYERLKLVSWETELTPVGKRVGGGRDSMGIAHLIKKVDSVTGIREVNPNTRVAEFTWLWALEGLDRKLDTAPEANVAVLSKYDDGWRVSDIRN